MKEMVDIESKNTGTLPKRPPDHAEDNASPKPSIFTHRPIRPSQDILPQSDGETEAALAHHAFERSIATVYTRLLPVR